MSTTRTNADEALTIAAGIEYAGDEVAKAIGSVAEEISLALGGLVNAGDDIAAALNRLADEVRLANEAREATADDPPGT